MKKIILITAMTLLSLMAIAQNNDSIAVMEMIDNDVTTFLGIPVDGKKDDMMLELIKKKGFKPRSTGYGLEYLQGVFNGQDVMVIIATYRNKVYRVYIQENNAHSAGDIKLHYNNLVRQFEKNQNYIEPDKDQTIPDDVNISDEMINHEKKFIAEFYQKNKKMELSNVVVNGLNFQNKKVWFMISRHGENYYIAMYYDNLWNMPNGEDL